MPAYNILLPASQFANYIVPLAFRIFESASDATICQLLLSLPQTIVHLESDQIRHDLLMRVDEVLVKAIEDKNVAIISAVIKELHLLYREYRDSRVQDEFFESYQAFTLGIQKRLQSGKLIAAMQTKDWRCFDRLLSHVRKSVEYIE